MAKAKKTEETKVDNKVKYLEKLNTYLQIRQAVDQAANQHKSLTTQGVNFEGQLSALEEAFGFNREDSIREIQAKTK